MRAFLNFKFLIFLMFIGCDLSFNSVSIRAGSFEMSITYKNARGIFSEHGHIDTTLRITFNFEKEIHISLYCVNVIMCCIHFSGELCLDVIPQ